MIPEIRSPLVRRSTHSALKEERDAYLLALRSINDRVHSIRNDDEFVDQAEHSLTDIENILVMALNE
jgi:hypothetical protein